MSNSGEEEDALSRAAKAAEDLYHLRDTYFPRNSQDRISKLQHDSDLLLKLLDSIPPKERKSPMQRATFEYLRGKVLDVFPDYRKEAEDHLSKAVKLNPSLADAWLCLGNCIWKKGDLTAAKNCLSLALDKGPNKKILCQLSMLKRKMSQGAENKVELVDESIQHAKEAITLDVKDGYSWYNLGNAYLTSYFVTGAWDHTKLSHSLKAYQNAEKDEGMKSSPDMYFNSAIVNKYLENYQRALSGFEAAALKDPGLNAAEEAEKLVNLLDKVDNFLRGHVRAKRMATLASSLAAVNLKSSYRTVTIDLLSEGFNKALAVEGKVLFFIKSESASPLYYLLCDSNQTCFVLSVYGVRRDVIKEGDQLTLLDPNFRIVDLSWKEKRVAIEAAKSLVQGAIANKFDLKTISASSKNPICIADLGCSTGPNTFLAIQCIIEAIELKYQSQGLAIPEFQVFFNDHVSNDFNTLFKKLPSNRKYYAVGVPGSFYGRLFPRESLNVVHSSASLNWISKVPKEITDRTCAAWNKGRIHYTNAPKEVVDAYASQYQKDMEIFLHARAQELVGNGIMTLQIPAVNDVVFDSDVYCGKNFELLETCLVDMAKEGKINEEHVDSFNLPIYFSPLKDLMKIVGSNDDFSIEQMETMDTKTLINPFNVQAYVSFHRAALEGLIENHFGDGIVDELFDRYAKKVMEIPAIMDVQKLNVVGLFVLLRRKQQCE